MQSKLWILLLSDLCSFVYVKSRCASLGWWADCKYSLTMTDVVQISKPGGAELRYFLRLLSDSVFALCTSGPVELSCWSLNISRLFLVHVSIVLCEVPIWIAGSENWKETQAREVSSESKYYLRRYITLTLEDSQEWDTNLLFCLIGCTFKYLSTGFDLKSECAHPSTKSWNGWCSEL